MLLDILWVGRGYVLLILLIIVLAAVFKKA
jgi:hypothetical protein